jgi:pimeloyl-ACP methyl ester carboxylesterase
VRQPEVARRLALLAAALLLAAPVAVSARALVVAAAFLLEFLSDGARPALTLLTAPPRADALGADTDRFQPGGFLTGRPLVLVHGLTPAGKDDPRVRRAARLLARAGFDVAVPTIPGLTRARLRPDDAAPVAAALAARPGTARIVSVSVGAGPAFLAAAQPGARDRVRLVLALGAYASAVELIRFHPTGEYAWDGVRGRAAAEDPAVSRAVLDANAELAEPALRTALASGDADAVGRALAALPESTRHLLDAVSPVRVVAAVRAPIVLVHGRDDPAVPFTESLRLAAARPAQTRVVLVGAIAHDEGGAAASALDLARLVGVVYALVAAD